MNAEIIFGLVRHVLTLVGGYYVSKGQIDQSSVDTVIGALTGIAGVAWSVKHKLS
jgi:hypothetical protein